MPVPSRLLDPDRINRTIELLEKRIRERFPKAHLGDVCAELLTISRDTQKRSTSIGRPMYLVRLLVVVVVIATLVGLGLIVTGVKIPDRALSAPELVQVSEAGFNAILLIGAAFLFLISLERRIKRQRCFAALHELRSLAHIIDMHQLTKDPDRLLRAERQDTASSPQPTMTAFELNRYLDYCTEMLSLIGKVAALYVQQFNDESAVNAVNDIESLTTDLARKIWQKIMVLQEQTQAEMVAAISSGMTPSEITAGVPTGTIPPNEENHPTGPTMG